jgi:hypothetical protein
MLVYLHGKFSVLFKSVEFGLRGRIAFSFKIDEEKPLCCKVKSVANYSCDRKLIALSFVTVNPGHSPNESLCIFSCQKLSNSCNDNSNSVICPPIKL